MKIKLIALNLLCVAAFACAGVKINYGVSTHQNKRPYQEDRFTHADIYYSGFFMGDFFGVYDGHGGSHVSHFLAQNLHTDFADRMKLPIDMLFSVIFTDADMIAQNRWPNQGSTALVAFVDKANHLDCAWVGDTRAVLESKGKVGFITNDHKPDRKDERKRIQRAGGKVEMHGVWRVNGLAVSRSIGDKNIKDGAKGKIGTKGQIIATPEYAHIQLKPENHFMIMASDGLWDVMSNEEAVGIVSKALQNGKSLNTIAQILQDEAIKRGSGDNITVCVIQFDWQAPRESLFRRWLNWLQGK